ncbi:MAG TPA: cation:proton antiporter [Usitatibacter sp.]|nr:cation:proton antiporter [Usitatibacter sp.]
MNNILPSLPLELSYPLLFGVLLVAGMMGGELARLLKLPRIIGYVVVGFVIGPIADAMGMRPLIDEARIFVDLSLGLVLFELGRRMDVRWMRRELSLIATGITESTITFAAVFATLLAFDVQPVKAGLAAAIAMTTAPTVLLFMTHETRSEGQVTERAINLVALNGLFASVLVTILLGSAHFARDLDVETAIFMPFYLLVGSLVVGAAMATFTRVVARAVERSSDVHFTLILGMVAAAVGVASLLNLPVILALLAFGLFARNTERGHDLLTVSLAPVGRLLYVVLFVITGASMPLTALADAGWMALAVLLARAAGKFLGAMAMAPLGGLGIKQAAGLGLALMPMSTLALLMYHDIAKLFPGFGRDVGPTFLTVVIVMEVLGPLAVQHGFRLARESLPDETGAFRALKPGPSN